MIDFIFNYIIIGVVFGAFTDMILIPKMDEKEGIITNTKERFIICSLTILFWLPFLLINTFLIVKDILNGK